MHPFDISVPLNNGPSITIKIGILIGTIKKPNWYTLLEKTILYSTVLFFQ